jgi:hypothetical protein
MPRKASRKANAHRARTTQDRSRSERNRDATERGGAEDGPAARDRNRRETTAIVLRIAAERAADFESMFAAEEIPIWDDFTRRGRFLEASLIRAAGGSEERDGIQDYILHVVAADHEAHEEHDRDARFRRFLAKAQQWQPEQPLVWFGDILYERRSREPAMAGSR